MAGIGCAASLPAHTGLANTYETREWMTELKARATLFNPPLLLKNALKLQLPVPPRAGRRGQAHPEKEVDAWAAACPGTGGGHSMETWRDVGFPIAEKKLSCLTLGDTHCSGL